MKIVRWSLLRFGWIFITVFCLNATVLFSGTEVKSFGDTESNHKILIISSFHFSHRWSQEVVYELRRTLMSKASAVSIDVLELNAVQLPPEKQQTFAAPYLEGVSKGEYSLVVAVLDDAVELLVRNHLKLPKSLPVIAYSKNETLDKLREVHPNAGGIDGQFELRGAINAGLKLFPGSREVLVILDPHFERYGSSMRFLREFSVPNVKISILNGRYLSARKMAQRIDMLPEKSFVVFGFYRDYKRDGFPSITSLAEFLTSYCQSPFLVVTDMFFNCGVLGGVTAKGKENGAILSDLALAALAAPDLRRMLPRQEENRLFVDMNVARRFQERMGKIPEGSELRNRKLNVWDLYRNEMILGICALGVFGVFGTLSVVLFMRWRQLQVQSRYNRMLQAEALNAEKAARARTIFLATMSHEIRTPLNAVIGLSDLLREPAIDAGLRDEYLTAINGAGSALLNLINDILDLSKLESGQLHIVVTRNSIARMCHELEAIFLCETTRKGITFRVDIPDDIPQLFIDSKRLRQILLNLVGNAVKFTEKGGVTVTVLFQAGGAGLGKLTLKVADTGPGISLEQQETIFHPVSPDESNSFGSKLGVGLGLPLVGRLIQRMGGSLKLESTPGSGCCFSVILDGISYIAPSASESDAAGSPKQCGGKLLIVDDILMNTRILEAMGKKLGCECRSVHSAAEALEELKSFLPDWILTDIWMPGMSGDKLAEEIRRNQEWRKIRIAAVTADSEAHQRFEMKYFDRIVLKPVKLQVLRSLLCGE